MKGWAWARAWRQRVWRQIIGLLEQERAKQAYLLQLRRRVRPATAIAVTARKHSSNNPVVGVTRYPRSVIRPTGGKSTGTAPLEHNHHAPLRKMSGHAACREMHGVAPQ
jgi:hypothetical protein